MHINLVNAKADRGRTQRKKPSVSETQECIAVVVNSGANLKAFLRMDDAWVGSIDIAIEKLRTACYLPCPPVSSASCLNQESRSIGVPMMV